MISLLTSGFFGLVLSSAHTDRSVCVDSRGARDRFLPGQLNKKLLEAPPAHTESIGACSSAGQWYQYMAATSDYPSQDSRCSALKSRGSLDLDLPLLARGRSRWYLAAVSSDFCTDSTS